MIVLQDLRNVRRFLAGDVVFEMTPEIRRVMEEMFDIEEGKPYLPSRRIAEIILAPHPPQKIPLSDRYLWQALFNMSFLVLRRALVPRIKSVLGIEQSNPLLGWKRQA